MKSLDDLKQIKISSRIIDKNIKVKILIGTSMCGLSAGADIVLEEFNNIIKYKNLPYIIVKPVGCIGECSIEPIVDIFEGIKRTTYCKVTKSDVERIINEHIINGNIVNDLIIGNYRI